MKNVKFSTLILAASLPLILVCPALANDNTGSHEKGGQHREGRSVRTFTSHAGSGVATVAPGSPRERLQSNPISYSGRGYHPAESGRYNRSNNYGGHWFPRNTHPAWDWHRRYYWHHHHYCWYDGGWLIIDGGFWPNIYPYGYYREPVYYPDPDYYPARAYDSDYDTDNSPVMNVQRGLARLGYYHGPIDGVFGPMTGSAIRRYQIDRGIAVTGSINHSLMRALGLD